MTRVPQAMSGLLSLPPEVRQLIYINHFSCQTFISPFYTPSLLLLSKQVRAEAMDCFYRNAEFLFRSIKHFMDFFTSIDKYTITQLRYVSIRAHDFMLTANLYPHIHNPIKIGFRLDDLLYLFPGLQLQTLKIINMSHGNVFPGIEYSYIDNLVKSQGYMELSYSIPNGVLKTSFRNSRDHEIYGHQPSTWDAMIKKRDGFESGARVEMHQLIDGVFFPIANYNSSYDSLYDCFKNIEIRIKRGKNASCVMEQSTNGDTFHSGILRCFAEMTWNQMKAGGFFVDLENDYDSSETQSEDEEQGSEDEEFVSDENFVSEDESASDAEQSSSDEDQSSVDGDGTSVDE